MVLFGVDAASQCARNKGFRRPRCRMHASQEIQQRLTFGFGELHQPLCLELPCERQHLVDR